VVRLRGRGDRGGRGVRARHGGALGRDAVRQILLLDKPTTFLDIAHQVEGLDLCADLHDAGRTLVMVLHDLDQACRYATRLIAMRDGAIVAQEPPGDTVTEELVAAVFGLECRVIPDPETGTPLVIPSRRACPARCRA
jgi:iron complex transport system ATP-binding protein